MEKLYTLEDELITLTDVIIKQEKVLHGEKDVHGIYNISTTVDTVKSIHRQVVSSRNLSTYIVNPVNMYHMTKRLAKEWTKVIATLEDSKSCQKVMRVRVQNIADNIPTGKYLKHVISGILRLQAIYNISVNDVISGKFFESPSISSMSVDDAFEFARVAYESKYYYLAIDWLQEVISLYENGHASFKLSNAMNLMSSAYLKLKQPKEALRILDELLKSDPENVVAKRNSKYILQKIDGGMKDIDVHQQELKNKKEKQLQKLCRNSTKIQYSSPRQFCTYTRRRDMRYFEKPDIQTEVLSVKPLVVIYKNITTPSQQKAVAHLGYEQMKAIMYKNVYTHPYGMEGLTVEDYTNWKWIPNLQRTLDNFQLLESYPKGSGVTVRNIGLHGLENAPLDKRDFARVGTFVVFLSEPKYSGGHFVFPSLNIRVRPEKGTVLFYEKTLHRQASVCPVVADTEWVGIYPVVQIPFSDFCFKDTLRRPKAK